MTHTRDPQQQCLGPPQGLGGYSILVVIPLLLFIVSTVFDPADLILGLKVELFLACWAVTLWLSTLRMRGPGLPAGLWVYTLVFLFVPTASIAWYYASDGSQPFAGFQLLRGYLLITFSGLLFINRINLLPQLSAVLSLLAMVIIMSFIALTVDPSLLAVFRVGAAASGIAFLTERDYGGGLVLLQVYFVTSPMLAISIAYYFHRAWCSTTTSKVWIYRLLMALSTVGMFLAGTRNNIAVSILLPLFLYASYARSRAMGFALALGASFALVILFLSQLQTLLDPDEFSNSIKLALVQDYSALFTDAGTLLLGRGLGAYDFWSEKGQYYFFTSELTYFELVRNFGIVGAGVMFLLILFPVIYAFVINRSFGEKHIVGAYGFYLLTCFSNPNMFSSMGVLILSVILANIFLFERARVRRRTPT